MKQIFKNVFKDSIIYGFGNAILAFYQLLILPILTNNLSQADFGIYNYLGAINTIFATVVILGMDSASVRFLYDYKKDENYKKVVFTTGFLIQLIMSLLLILAYFFYGKNSMSLFSVKKEQLSLLLFTFLNIPFLAFVRYFQNWFKWIKNPKKFIVITITFLLSLAICIIYLKLSNTLTLYNIIALSFFCQVLTFFVGVLMTLKFFSKHLNVTLFIKMLLYGMPFFVIMIMSALRSNIDRLLIKDKIDEVSFGIYTFMQRISLIISMCTTAFDVAIGPLIFSSWDTEEGKKSFKILQTSFIIFISFVFLSLVAISKIIITILGNPMFLKDINVFVILSFSNLMYGLLAFATIGISYAKKSIYNLVISTICLLVLYISSYFLTTRFFEIGISISILLGTISLIISGYYFSNKFYKVNYKYLFDAKILIFSLSIAFFFANTNFSENYFWDSFLKFFILIIITGIGVLTFSKKIKKLYMNYFKKSSSLFIFIICTSYIAIGGPIKEVSILKFGAIPNDKISDHDAFERASIFINTNKENIRLFIPLGSYIVGKQVFYGGNLGSRGYECCYGFKEILSLKNCSNIEIIGEYKNGKKPVIFFDKGFKFGTFDPINGNAPSNKQYFNPVLYTKDVSFSYQKYDKYIAEAGNLIEITGHSKNISIKNLDLNGQSETFNLGGSYGIGNKAYELTHTGIRIENAYNINISNIDINNFAFDAIYIKNYNFRQNAIIFINNCKINNCGRQGISWTGGNGLKISNTSIQNIGNGRIQNAPSAGIDIEPDSNLPCLNGTFTNIKFENCMGGCVIASNSSDEKSGNIIFNKCFLIGAKDYKAININIPNCKITNSTIIGGFNNGFDAVNDSDKTRITNCIFKDSYKGIIYGNDYSLVTSLGKRKIEITNCKFETISKAYLHIDCFDKFMESKKDTSYLPRITNCVFTSKTKQTHWGKVLIVSYACIFIGNNFGANNFCKPYINFDNKVSFANYDFGNNIFGK